MPSGSTSPPTSSVVGAVGVGAMPTIPAVVLDAACAPEGDEIEARVTPRMQAVNAARARRYVGRGVATRSSFRKVKRFRDWLVRKVMTPVTGCQRAEHGRFRPFVPEPRRWRTSQCRTGCFLERVLVLEQ